MSVKVLSMVLIVVVAALAVLIVILRFMANDSEEGQSYIGAPSQIEVVQSDVMPEEFIGVWVPVIKSTTLGSEVSRLQRVRSFTCEQRAMVHNSQWTESDWEREEKANGKLVSGSRMPRSPHGKLTITRDNGDLVMVQEERARGGRIDIIEYNYTAPDSVVMRSKRDSDTPDYRILGEYKIK